MRVLNEVHDMSRLQPVLNKSEEALVAQMAELTQAKKTDVIKNALTVYHWFIKQTVGGASVVARKASGEEATLHTPELALLEGQGVRLSPAELNRLATDLVRARDPKVAAHIRERMTRGFYGI